MGAHDTRSATSVRIGSHYHLSEFRESEAVLQAALREVSTTDNRAARLYLSLNEINYLLSHGKGDEALARLRKQRKQLPKSGFGMYHALHRAAVCFAACATQSHAWGLACLEEDWPRFLKFPMRRAGTIHLLARGARVQLLLNHHVMTHREGNPLPVSMLKAEIKALDKCSWQGRAGSIAELARARLALLTGDREAALKHLERSRSLAETQRDRERARYAIGSLIGGQKGLEIQRGAAQYLTDQGLPDPDVYFRGYMPEFQP